MKRHQKLRVLLVCLSLQVAASASAQWPDEFHINPDRPVGVVELGDGQDVAPALVSMAADGTFVVVWQTGSDSDPNLADADLYFRRFAADGTPLMDFSRRATPARGRKQCRG